MISPKLLSNPTRHLSLDTALDHIQSIDDSIPELVRKDQQKAMELLLGLGGNILFLSNLCSDIINKIDKKLWIEYEKNRRSRYADTDTYDDFDYYSDIEIGSYIYTYFETGDYNDNSRAFDVSIDALEAESDSGGFFDFDDDGDSDSSCGSCGGCGGCD